MGIIKKIKLLDKNDRIVLFLFISTISNFIVAGVKFVLAINIPSLWFFINGLFYLTLSIGRYSFIKRYKHIRLKVSNEERLKYEYKNYFHNGIMLIFLGIIYFFVSSYMYYNGTNTNMHEYITYLVALVAFSSIGSSIYGMIKYKKSKSPIINGIKITNFAKALTSIVLTQVVLLDTFAKGYDSCLNGYTGMFVSLVIMILGLYMILSTKKEF